MSSVSGEIRLWLSSRFTMTVFLASNESTLNTIAGSAMIGKSRPKHPEQPISRSFPHPLLDLG
jgi:hypothetical protein